MTDLVQPMPRPPTAEPSNLPIVNKTGAAVVVGFVMIFSVAMIVWTTLYGNTANTLHISAQSWSFALILVVLGAVGLAPLLSVLLPVFNAPKK